MVSNLLGTGPSFVEDELSLDAGKCGFKMECRSFTQSSSVLTLRLIAGSPIHCAPGCLHPIALVWSTAHGWGTPHLDTQIKQDQPSRDLEKSLIDSRPTRGVER